MVQTMGYEERGQHEPKWRRGRGGQAGPEALPKPGSEAVVPNPKLNPQPLSALLDEALRLSLEILAGWLHCTIVCVRRTAGLRGLRFLDYLVRRLYGLWFGGLRETPCSDALL